jgi:hypothetical protein
MDIHKSNPHPPPVSPSARYPHLEALGPTLPKFPRNRPDRGEAKETEREFLSAFFEGEPKRSETQYKSDASQAVAEESTSRTPPASTAPPRAYKTTSAPSLSSLDLSTLTPLTLSLLFPPPSFVPLLRSPKLLHESLGIPQQHSQTAQVITAALSYLLSLQHSVLMKTPPPPPPNM